MTLFEKGDTKFSTRCGVPRPDQYAIIIGAMKAGTTYMYDQLANHPQVCPSKVKEPEYFSVYPSATDVCRYNDLWDFDSGRHLYVLEASTGYSKSKSENVPSEIKKHGLNPKFIYIVRNPFDRIESHYNFMKRSLSQHWNGKITSDHLIETSNYIKHIERYEGIFGADAIKIITFEELSSDPLAVVNATCKFLRIHEVAEIEKSAKRNPTNYRSSALEAALIRKFGNKTYFLPSQVKRTIRRIITKVPGSGKRELTISEREYIRAKLSDGMKRLENRFGVDVGGWGF